MSEHEHNWVKSFLESLESMKIEEIFHENASQDLTNKSLVYVRGSHKKAKKSPKNTTFEGIFNLIPSSKK